MMTVLRGRRLVVLALLAAGGAVAGTGTPAPAADAGIQSFTFCVVAPFRTSCTTNAIPARPDMPVERYVHSGYTGQGCSWRLRDVTDQEIVETGRVGAISGSSRTFSLDNWYRLELFSCWSGARGQLESDF